MGGHGSRCKFAGRDDRQPVPRLARDREPIATGELISHPSGLARLELRVMFEELLKRAGRDKLTIKCALDQVDGAWEMKGSDARCIDPVHIYGPRQYSCEKCTKQLHTYIQSKVGFLLNRGANWAGINWPE